MPRDPQPPDFEARYRSDKSDKSDASTARTRPQPQTAGQPHQHAKRMSVKPTSSCRGWPLGQYTHAPTNPSWYAMRGKAIRARAASFRQPD